MKDYYGVLGLKRNCSSQEIRSKFIELTKEFHPDRNPDKPYNHEKILLINEAYSILSKPQLKQSYDISLRNGSFYNGQDPTRSTRTPYERPPPPFYTGDKMGFEQYGHGAFYWDTHKNSQRQTQQEWDAWHEELNRRRFYQNQHNKNKNNYQYQQRNPPMYARSPLSNSHVVGGTIAIMLLSCYFHYLAVKRSSVDEPNARLKPEIITRRKTDEEYGLDQLKNLETKYPPKN